MFSCRTSPECGRQGPDPRWPYRRDAGLAQVAGEWGPRAQCDIRRGPGIGRPGGRLVQLIGAGHSQAMQRLSLGKPGNIVLRGEVGRCPDYAGQMLCRVKGTRYWYGRNFRCFSQLCTLRSRSVQSPKPPKRPLGTTLRIWILRSGNAQGLDRRPASRDCALRVE